MNAMLRFLAFIGLLTCCGLLGWFFFPRADKHLPDERKVAMQMLAERQSGPGYFQPADPAEKPDEQGIFWLPAERAGDQLDRIVRERKGAVTRERLQKLIAEVAEPQPSRAIGGDRLNLARLNLALDALH